MSSFYILEIKPLSEVSLANMFSHTVGSLFILILFSLAKQKLFICMKSHLFILSCMFLALGDLLVKYCCMEYLRFSCLYCLQGLLLCHDLHLSLLSSRFVCVCVCVWCKLVVKFHFFFMKLPRFTNTIC